MRSFVKVFLVLFIPLFIALTLTFYFAYDTTTANARQELLQEMKNKWVIVAQLLHDNDPVASSTYDRLADITRRTFLRISVIDTSGRVLTDSLVARGDIAAMENHKARPEVKAAIYYGEGFSTRYSSTVKMPMLYFARKLDDNTVLRLAYPETYVAALQQKLTHHALGGFVALTLVVLLLALYFAGKVSLPVQRLYYIAEAIESGREHVHFPRFKDKAMARVAGLIYRIYTALQRKNYELERDRKKLNHIFTTMDQGVLLLDGDNVILHANPWLEQEFGVTFTPGTNLFDISNDIPLINFFSTMAAQRDEYARITLKQRVFDCNVRQVEDQKLVLLRNVTRQVEYEVFKAELTGNISHELKTPLAMIMGYAETLRDNPAISAQQRQHFLDNIYISSQRLNNLINDVIELHKLESVGDNFTVSHSVVPEDIAAELRAFYADSGAAKLTITATDTPVFISAEHLRSVLTNLIDNAIKYSDSAVVSASVSADDGMVSITVDDGGPPIEESQRQRIFERFYTCSRSRNKQHSGTGLGLSIVKHIASLYRGSAGVETNSAGGNRFYVKLCQRRRGKTSAKTSDRQISA